jgi:ABC-type transporter MlaC component
LPWAFDVNSGRYRNAPELAKRFRILASQRSDFNDRLTFAHYISATYADRFDSYSGEQPQVTGEQSYGTEVI